MPKETYCAPGPNRYSLVPLVISAVQLVPFNVLINTVDDSGWLLEPIVWTTAYTRSPPNSTCEAPAPWGDVPPATTRHVLVPAPEITLKFSLSMVTEKPL